MVLAIVECNLNCDHYSAQGGWIMAFNLRPVLVVLGSFLVVTGPTPTLGDDSNLIEEITVTAQKRAQDLQDVGISVTAFSARQLRELGLTEARDLNQQVPSLMITDLASVPTISVVTIRGVNQNDFADHNEAPVAVYRDGVYTSFIGAVGGQMYDLERVEVIRGPQGTLFGRNATGGLIHLISAKPHEQFEAYSELTVGDYNQIRFEGAINGALSDNVFGRVAVLTNKHDGWMKNRIGEDANSADARNIRAQLLISPTESVDLLFRGSFGEDVDVTASGYHIEPSIFDDALGETRLAASQAEFEAFCEAVFGIPATPGQSTCFGHTEDGDRTTGRSTGPNFFEREVSSFGLTATVEFERATLTSITDFIDLKKAYEEDSDSEPDVVANFFASQDAKQFSQEFRLDGNTDSLVLGWWTVLSRY